ncbi:hypothetical protein [Pantoea anthophila]|uniref:hypothetical protein n=1 Tax=Pantoea anthophila TaxID=470931 RepID=UPI003CF60413
MQTILTVLMVVVGLVVAARSGWAETEAKMQLKLQQQLSGHLFRLRNPKNTLRYSKMLSMFSRILTPCLMLLSLSGCGERWRRDGD